MLLTPKSLIDVAQSTAAARCKLDGDVWVIWGILGKSALPHYPWRMAWKFLEFELDPSRVELRGPEGNIHIERQVFDLLTLLADNPDRVLEKDEIIEKVWGGRVVSDSAVSTCIKHMRRALGDDGTAQRIIKTVHGRGFRFVAPITRQSAIVPGTDRDELQKEAATTDDNRPSIAVLPFQAIGDGKLGSLVADAVPAELISALSRLRWLFVIARGSSFRFRGFDTPPEKIGELLNVGYLLSGMIEVLGDSLTVSVELIYARNGAVIWSDRLSTSSDKLTGTREHIIADVVAALELNIPANEAAAAKRMRENEFTAWTHYHLGLHHIYRFNRSDSEIAGNHFKRATELDPEFARAWAALSLAHWQKAFMGFGDDRRALVGVTENAATRAYEIDPQDSFVLYNMGRSQWLKGDLDGSVEWLDRAVHLNPNFAQGYYAQAFAHALSGRSTPSLAASQQAIELSPIDPLYYAMIGTRALSMIAEENYTEGSELAERAANSPGAHFYMDAIAAIANQLDGSKAKTPVWCERIRERRPDFSSDLFMRAFPISAPRFRNNIKSALIQLGF